MSDVPVVLVTGARKGIGRFLAEHFLQQGCVVIGCSRQSSDLSHAAYRHHELDVADEPSVRRLFTETAREFKRLDALINNAGLASMNHALLTPASTAEQILRTNVLGTFLFCREAAKQMQRRGTGRIVNFGTVATALHLEGEAVYAASKAAVESLTTVLAREFAPFGVTVNSVAPTPLRTDLIRGVPEDKLQALVERQAVKRFGEMRDVLNVIEFFLRAESDFVTGQTVYLGGIR